MNPIDFRHPRPRPGAGLLGGLVLALCVGPASGASFELDGDVWARPRSAATVRAMNPVRDSVQAWMEQPAQIMEIHYPGGETGMLWAEELRDWLVSLGIPLDRIETLSGSAAADRLQFRLRQLESKP